MRKPPFGARINPAHPLGQDAVLDVLFNEGWGVPSVVVGVNRVGIRPPMQLALSGAPIWASNGEGVAGRAPASTDKWVSTAISSWMPTAQITIAAIKRKNDTTLRQSALMSSNGGGTWGGTSSLMPLVPWSDGTIYWDFGGTGGANRLTVAGLSFSTSIPDRWILTAGPRGSSIWQNGVKVANQTTAISRVNSATDQFAINGSPNEAAAQGDVCDINILRIIDAQWSDDLCRWWSAEPYAHLFAPTIRRYAFFGSAAVAAGHPTHYYAQQRQQAS